MTEPPLNGRHGWSVQSLLVLAVLAVQILGVYIVQKSAERVSEMQATILQNRAQARDADRLEHQALIDVGDGIIYMLSLEERNRPGVIKPKAIRRLELQADTDHYIEGQGPLHERPQREYRPRERMPR